jgi:hypothetical protein
VIEPAGEAVEPLVSWLATYLLHSTVLVSAVWLGVRLRIFRAARTQDLLWKVALLGGIATSAGGTLRAYLPRSGEVIDELDVRVRILRGQEALRWTPAPAIPAGGEARPEAAGPAAACRGAVARLDESSGSLATLASACMAPADSRAGPVALVWLVVGVLAMGMDARRRRLLRGVLAAGGPAGSGTRRALRRVIPDGSPLPEVRVTHLVASPCVHGAAIVLPARCELELSDAELEAVLAHEWGHVSRRDGLWTGIADVVVSVLWVQPLNRLARSGLRRAAELVCDDWAVDRTGRGADLARSILQVAVWSGRHAGPQPASALARRRARGLSERVRRILGLEGGPPGRGRGRGWAAAVLLSVPLALLPVLTPKGDRTVVFARETIVTGRGPEVARGDSLRVEVRALRLR